MMVPLRPNQVTAVVLGIMQDGGLPHIGCRCRRCQQAIETSRPQYAACLAIVDGRDQPRIWLIDATPDIKHQLNWLANVLGPHSTRPDRLRQPDGIFLTHAHMGHISGLPQLGPEAMAVQDLPVWAAPGLVQHLKSMVLWQPLLPHLNLIPLTADQPVELAPRLTITPTAVPHRDEWGIGTWAFQVQGPDRSLLYVPDIDTWEAWPAARAWLTAVDYALVDASFYQADELGGRPPVAHPLIPHTLKLWADLPGQLILTHFNHTNPVLEANSLARQAVLAVGAHIASQGQVFAL